MIFGVHVELSRRDRELLERLAVSTERMAAALEFTTGGDGEDDQAAVDRLVAKIRAANQKLADEVQAHLAPPA